MFEYRHGFTALVIRVQAAHRAPPYGPVCVTSEGVFLLFPFIGYSTVHVRPQIQVPAQGGEDLYLQVGDGLGGGGQGRRGHGAVQQGVGRVAARGVRCLPVRFQVVGQMLAGVLQLVLIQDDVE